MTDSNAAADENVPAAPDRVPTAEYLALGCGCLLTVLIFAAAILVGLTRN